MAVVVRVFTDIQSIQHDWWTLARQVGSHFLHYPCWYQAQLLAYPVAEQVFFVGVYDNHGLAAVIPLQATQLKVKSVSIPGLTLFYPNEMGVADITTRIPLAPVRPLIYRQLRRQGAKFWFIKYHSLLASSHCLASGLFSTADVCKPSHTSKYLSIADGEENFYQHRNKKLRRNIRQKQGYANQTGELQVKSITTPEKLPEAYRIFLDLEASGWKGEQNSSIQQQSNKRHYYDHLFAGYSQEQQLIINLLYVGEHCIAGQFGVLCGRTLYLLKIAYDEDYSHLSPGYLLIHELITDDQRCYDKLSFVTGISWADRWYPEIDQVWVGYDFTRAWLNRLGRRLLDVKNRRQKPVATATDSVPAEE